MFPPRPVQLLNSTELNTQLNSTELNWTQLNSKFSIYLSMHYKMRTKHFRQGQSSWYERICQVHWATHKYEHQSNHVGLGSNWPVVWQYDSHHKRPRLLRNRELGHQEEQLGQQPEKKIIENYVKIFYGKKSNAVQVNLFQKHLFLPQLSHNMTKDCSLNH